MTRKNIRLSEAIDLYAFHCRAAGLGDGTVRTYLSALNTMLKTVGNVEVAQLSSRHLDLTFANRQWSASSRNSRLAQYKGFFAWCRSAGYMKPDQNPAFGWRNSRVANVERQRIPVGEWPRLFNACIHPQETIALATGLYLFLRGSEQKRIQLKHVMLSEGEIQIFRKKTQDYDNMPISAELYPYLRNHMVWMAEQGFSDPDHYLIGMRYGMGVNQHKQFVAGTGKLDATKPFGSPHIVIRRILKRAGYPDFREGEHTLRRSGARAYFDSLVDLGYDGALKEVQSMLGHSAGHMTERYLGLRLDRQKRNARLKGKPMFPALQDANIVLLRQEM